MIEAVGISEAAEISAAKTSASFDFDEALKNMDSDKFKIESSVEKEFDFDDELNKMDSAETDKKSDAKISEFKEFIKSYIDELIKNSPCPETLKGLKDLGELELKSPEEVKKLRQEFNNNRDKLIKEWEAKNNCEWPKYEKDVLSKNGTVVRKAGDYMEVHHIKPLTLGGKNTVDNITPMHYDNHNDRQGIHSPNSGFSKICETLKEGENK